MARSTILAVDLILGRDLFAQGYIKGYREWEEVNKA
jgi:hypothetical protein